MAPPTGQNNDGRNDVTVAVLGNKMAERTKAVLSPVSPASPVSPISPASPVSMGYVAVCATAASPSIHIERYCVYTTYSAWQRPVGNGILQDLRIWSHVPEGSSGGREDPPTF